MTALRRDCADWAEPLVSETGLHLTVALRSPGVGYERELAQRALARGVRVGRLSEYCLGRPARTGLVLGYGAIEVKRIDEGMRRLRACV